MNMKDKVWGEKTKSRNFIVKSMYRALEVGLLIPSL